MSNDKEQWIWSEKNDGWYCEERGLQMVRNDEYFRAWGHDGATTRFNFQPTPQQVEAVFKARRVWKSTLTEAHVRRIEARHGRKPLPDQLRDMGWQSNNSKYFEAEGMQLISLGYIRFRIHDGSKSCVVNFPLTPAEARRALDRSQRPDQRIFLNMIKAKKATPGWTEDHGVFRHEDLVMMKHQDGLYLVWPKDAYSAKQFVWAYARLGFFPTPTEAEAAITLSPCQGEEMAPLFSRDQIERFTAKSPEEQDKQIEHARRFFNNDGSCNHPTCSKCGEEVSCMEESTLVGAYTYHKNCWRKKAKKTSTPRLIEQMRNRGWTLRPGSSNFWRAPGLCKWEIPSKGVWAVGTDENPQYAWVHVDFDPTPEEARFCLLLSTTRGKKKYEGPVITRVIYAQLSCCEAAIETLRTHGFTFDQEVLEQLQCSLDGVQTFEEFMRERSEEEPKAPEVTFEEGDVVDILEDIHFETVLARGRVCLGGEKKGWDKQRRVDVYIPAINAVRTPTKTRLRKVPKEEL
jgi:hypothetical protein